MQFGVGLYSIDGAPTNAMLDAARRAERLGFGAASCMDHILRAAASYQVELFDPLTALTAVGAVTEQLKLATTILVLPIRNPVLVAKALASMEFLFPNRVIVGVGAGWNPQEYAAAGVPLAERFPRLAEYIEILRQCLNEPSVSYQGRFMAFSDVQIHPFPAGRIPLWIGAGTQTPRGGQEIRRLTRRAAQRIATADGWITSPNATHDLHRADWEAISAQARAMGKDPEALARVSYDYCYVVDTTNRERALAEQQKVMEPFFGYSKTWEFVKTHSLVGTPDEVARRMAERTRAIGLNWWFLQLMTPDPDQVDGLAQEILPRYQAYLQEGPGYVPPAA